MKKKSIRFLSLVLSATMFLSLTGCNKNKIDNTKTQINIFSYDAGVGSIWLENLATEFQEKYAGTVFEEGKKGVQVHVRKSPSGISQDTIKGSDNDIFFTQGLNYGVVIPRGDLLDITDIVTESLSEVTAGKETGSIADKLDEGYKAALVGIDGKHHILPYYEVYSGVTYDKKVFNDHSLYLREGIDGGFKFTNAGGNRSVGPDGVRGSYDDGLPSSVEEFYALIDKMTRENVIPFVWAGQYPSYTDMFIVGAWAAMSGKDQMMLALNFNSNAGDKTVLNDTVVGFGTKGNFSSNGEPVVEQIEIDDTNGYYTTQQVGKYYAYEMFSKVLSDKKYYHEDIGNTFSHLDAQEAFIYSDLDDSEKPIGMMIEGSYWYNEAREAEIFKMSEDEYRGDAKNRDFAVMPLPVQAKGQVTEGNGRKNTLVNAHNAVCFANTALANKPGVYEAVKKFLQMCYSDEYLQKFTLTTSTFMGVNYPMPQLSADTENYVKSLHEIKANSDVVYPYSANKIFIKNFSRFCLSPMSTVYGSNVGGQYYTESYSPFRFNGAMTPQKYFKGTEITAADWAKDYNK